MDYAQFMKKMDDREFTGKDSISLLQEYVKEFPYFQTAQLLLARAMHEQQHVRFEKQLKLASAYAGDRKILYNMIHPGPPNLFSEKSFPVSESISPEPSDTKQKEENIFVEEKPLIPPPEKEEIASPQISEYHFTPSMPVYTEEPEIMETEADIDDGPMVADPHEIIRRRLNEILGLEENNVEFKPRKTAAVVDEKTEKENIDVKEETGSEEKVFNEKVNEENAAISPVPEEPAEMNPVYVSELPAPEVQEMKKDNLSKIIEESVRAKDAIDKGELEYALEATLIQSLEKLPVIEKEQALKQPAFVKQKEFTFYDWLKKSKVDGYGKFEEVHAEDTEIINLENTHSVNKAAAVEITKDVTLLIDKFIQSDPKIVPSKVEFYSPASQAKKSITEDEDLVSETLANIYRQQGNPLKARSCYQKLSLLYPEKMAYFAALISDIEKDLNNQQKEDL